MGEVGFFGAAAGLNNFGAAASQASSAQAQNDYERRMTNVNSGWAALQAQSVRQQGDFQAAQIRQYGEDVKASQRAAAAAGGVDVNAGSAAQIQAETEAMASLDALAARNNAFKEMMGIKASDSAARGMASQNRIARRSAAYQSIISAGARTAQDTALANYYYNQKGKGGTKPPYARQYGPMEDE